MTMKTDVADLAAAITLLEEDAHVDSWNITKITNIGHAIDPLGPGYGVTIWARDGRVAERVLFEKSGTERSILDAAKEALRRFHARLEVSRTQSERRETDSDR
jgi:hypothetical protein